MAVSLKEVIVYKEPRCESVAFEGLHAYLTGMLDGVTVSLRGPLFDEALNACIDHEGDSDKDDEATWLPASIAAARIRAVDRRVYPGQRVLAGEVDYETRRLLDSGSRSYGIVYDAELLSETAAIVLGKEGNRLDRVNVVITNQLIGTWEAADNRYHARVVYCGSPALVSVPGLTVAPARDREYYLAKQGAALLGLDRQQGEAFAEEYIGDFLDREDERITEVLKGYLMQPIAYRLTGEPFCEDSGCRLYNAHWQREMIAAQLGGDSEYCRQHQSLFRYS